MTDDHSAPASYPANDHAEDRSIALLKAKLNNRHLKWHISQRDKVPNTDGWLELTNSFNAPIAKFDLQIRSLTSDENKIVLDNGLVSYSEITTLPFLLIFVNLKTERIFWKQISRKSTPIPAQQKSVTVHFGDDEELIEKNLYFEKFLELSNGYKRAILGYIDMANTFPYSLDFSNIDKSIISFFKSFLHEYNGRINSDMKIVKILLLSNSSSIGIAILNSNNGWVTSTRYLISPGCPIPELSRFTGHPEDLNKFGNHSWNGMSLGYMTNGQEEAKNELVKSITDLVSCRKLQPLGPMLFSEESQKLFHGLGKAIGISEEIEISSEQIIHGFNYYLPRLVRHLFPDVPFEEEYKENLRVDVSLRSVIEISVNSPPLTTDQLNAVSGLNVEYGYYDARDFKEKWSTLIEFMKNRNIVKVVNENRMTGLHQAIDHLGNQHSYMYHTEEDYQRIESYILNERIILEYESFLLGNGIDISKSDLASGRSGMLVSYIPVRKRFQTRDVRDAFSIAFYRRSRRELPRIYVAEVDNSLKTFIDPRRLCIPFVEKIEITTYSSGTSNPLYGKFPVRELLYRILCMESKKLFSIKDTIPITYQFQTDDW